MNLSIAKITTIKHALGFKNIPSTKSMPSFGYRTDTFKSTGKSQDQINQEFLNKTAAKNHKLLRQMQEKGKTQVLGMHESSLEGHSS